METIKLDRSLLPIWAQRDENVVALCERDLGYRINVFNAKTKQYRRLLKMQAKRAVEKLQLCANCNGTGFIDKDWECPDCGESGII